MLKQDFNGYREFMEKLKKSSKEEHDQLYMERIQMWVNKIMNIINPLPGGDIAFVIVAVETIAKTLRKDSVEARVLADIFKMKIGATSNITTIEGDENTTEADVRAYAESLKKK